MDRLGAPGGGEDGGDALGGVTVAEERRRGALWVEGGDGFANGRGICTDEAVPALGDGLDPFGLSAEGEAGDGEPVGFFLHTAGIGEDEAGVALKSDHF